MTAISDNLIHFLGREHKDSPNRQTQTFKSIIENGLRTSNMLIKFSEGGSVTTQAICLTDIPIRDCVEHTSIYGKFGIGFKKSFVKNAGGNPSRYFLNYLPSETGGGGSQESRGVLFYNLCLQFKNLKYLIDLQNGGKKLTITDEQGNICADNERIKKHLESMIYSMSFDKETGDLGPARDENRDTDQYYKEREWRMVPSTANVGSGVAVNDPHSDKFFFRFERADVNMIVVPNEDTRADVLEYLLSLRSSSDERLKRFGMNALPIINFDDLHKW
ncbi:abortive infection system antitoxin AbiGi family protein [Methylibium sp.]|uniref:abortive infection system antitoxin AbiGi family protein n=1 Tax=Methylibium sp. TaxID=2067992 RepID=UPI003BAAAD8A